VTSGGTAGTYEEPGGTWRPFWLIAGFLVLLLLVDELVLGGGAPALVWVLAFLVVLGVVAGGTLSARRVWTVRIDRDGPDPALTVGRERVPLADVDAAHLRAVQEGAAGVDAGAPVLGGGWTLPRGRTGLPLKLTDGRTVLVPTRSPAALAQALVGAAPGGSTAPRGTLGT
jgi:hypothetical protein